MQKTAQTRAAALLRCDTASFANISTPTTHHSLTIISPSPSSPCAFSFVWYSTSGLSRMSVSIFFSFFSFPHEQFFLSSHEEANMPVSSRRDECCRGPAGAGWWCGVILAQTGLRLASCVVAKRAGQVYSSARTAVEGWRRETRRAAQREEHSSAGCDFLCLSAFCPRPWAAGVWEASLNSAGV